jgi:hypothetical protein
MMVMMIERVAAVLLGRDENGDEDGQEPWLTLKCPVLFLWFCPCSTRQRCTWTS